MPHRMFVAVVPPPEVVEDLSDFLEPRRDQGMPWIDPAQWHVTLAFMEAVPDRRVDDLVEHLDEAGAKRRPFTL
ncbi:MAG: 2'-5' RNA ligase family protein, partial [Lapillicoccus sp.]